MPDLQIALYARVSTDQQARGNTMDSQVAALRDRIGADGVALEAEDAFVDEGFSGTTLRRPALERLRDRVAFFDANDLALRMLGDSIYSNMLVLGAAWQQGLLPLSLEAIMQAIEMNGAKVAENQRAFLIGRWAMAFPDQTRKPAPVTELPPDPVAYREARLVGYQNKRLAKRFRKLVDAAPAPLRESVARGYYKLLAYKDEYEVARLHLPQGARPGWDYVLVGRPDATVSRDFADLCRDLAHALRKIHP